MCDAQTGNLIRESVQEAIDADEMFTAFDISRRVQAKLQAANLPFVRHRDIKNDIHAQVDQYVNSGVYSRQLHDVGAPTQAFLYFPPNADPNTYTPQDRPKDQLKVAAPQLAQLQVSDDSDDGDEADTGGRGVDARGSLCVPNHVIRAAGFQHGDIAYVSVNNGELIIAKQVPAGLSAQTNYKVDYSDNVRITAATLATIGSAVNGYDFERVNDRVVVRIH
jgi:hypothetical protein